MSPLANWSVPTFAYAALDEGSVAAARSACSRAASRSFNPASALARTIWAWMFRGYSLAVFDNRFRRLLLRKVLIATLFQRLAPGDGIFRARPDGGEARKEDREKSVSRHGYSWMRIV